MGNSYGILFKLTTFGESHGLAIGGVIDGCPSGFALDFADIQFDLDARKPGQNNLTSSRRENDIVEFLSGIFEGKTTGAPIAFIIKNNDHISVDYNHIKETFRPSHADFVYYSKYGIRDYRGGGRSSARETACRVVAGSIAKQILLKKGIKLFAYVNSVGNIRLNKKYKDLDLSAIYNNNVRCPDEKYADIMMDEILKVKHSGDTIGGEITVVAKGVPVGWGEPVFDKLHADIGKGMLSINAVHGFKYGFEDRDISSSKGSEVNDIIFNKEGKTKSNFSGGIQGGISNGNDIYCTVFFKPVATIMKDQQSISMDGSIIKLKGKGRHDACVVPRAVPIVSSMLAITLLDHYLRSLKDKIL